MNRGREERGGKGTDGCPLTVEWVVGLTHRRQRTVWIDF
jgi:hypothetical protein